MVIANDVDPIELVVLLPALWHKMGVPYHIRKGKARLEIHSTGRIVPLSPSHELTQQTKDLRLSWRKLLGPITMTDMMKSAITEEATSWVQSWWLALPSWKRQRSKNWPSN